MEKMNGKTLSLIKCAFTVALYSVTDGGGGGRLEPSDKHLAVFLAKLLQVSILLLIFILNKKKKNPKFVDISPISNERCSSNPGKKVKESFGIFCLFNDKVIKNHARCK